MKEIKRLIEVSRMVAQMNLKNEVSDIAAYTGQDKYTVRRYLNGEEGIPMWFKTEVYRQSLEVKSGLSPNDKQEYPQFESKAVTHDIRKSHPVHKHIEKLHKEIAILNTEYKYWLHLYNELGAINAEWRAKLQKEFFTGYMKDIKALLRKISSTSSGLSRDARGWIVDLLERIDNPR